MTVVGFTCLAATVFPFRSKDIYEASPVAQYEFGGVPLIAIAGAVGTIATAALVWVALTNSQLGLTSTNARLSIGGAFVSGIVVYIAMTMYRRGQGVDTSLAYRQVPPD